MNCSGVCAADRLCKAMHDQAVRNSTAAELSHYGQRDAEHAGRQAPRIFCSWGIITFSVHCMAKFLGQTQVWSPRLQASGPRD